MDKRNDLGCLEPFVPTFGFSVNNSDKVVPNEKKYTQKEFYDIVHKNNTAWKAQRRLQQQLQILRARYGDKYGYFD